MLSDDPFCVRHGVPFDAFEGCWRCASDAAEREKAKREVSNEKDAEIARLRAENEKLRAALASKTLRPETVEIARMAIDTMRQISDTDTDEEDEAMADLDRCYPPEED